jgi:hypothetical protein
MISYLLPPRLLGETWCYATILLIGQENCPHHHRHANELDRISHANDHIQYYDCHGRLCERLVVYDVLQRVYAENAPTRQDIMNPACVLLQGFTGDSLNILFSQIRYTPAFLFVMNWCDATSILYSYLGSAYVLN